MKPVIYARVYGRGGRRSTLRRRVSLSGTLPLSDALRECRESAERALLVSRLPISPPERTYFWWPAGAPRRPSSSAPFVAKPPGESSYVCAGFTHDSYYTPLDVSGRAGFPGESSYSGPIISKLPGRFLLKTTPQSVEFRDNSPIFELRMPLFPHFSRANGRTSAPIHRPRHPVAAVFNANPPRFSTS